jgi:hypothetical protein
LKGDNKEVCRNSCDGACAEVLIIKQEEFTDMNLFSLKKMILKECPQQ